ncbi:hypothetical protein Gohar_007474, partial [Gossypium harknessii]|nr:hypothetical protein [Gossypium harknessii]
IQLNTNATIKEDSRLATIKGVIRDRNERWILGYNQVLESYSALDAELWDILDSLTIALDRGFVSILIFSDRLEAYKLYRVVFQRSWERGGLIRYHLTMLLCTNRDGEALGLAEGTLRCSSVKVRKCKIEEWME